MDIDQNVLGLAALMVGGVELRVAVAALRREVRGLRGEVEQLDAEKQTRVGLRALKATASAVAILLPLLWCAAAATAVDPSLPESVGTGAAAGSTFGPWGTAIGAGVGALLYLIGRGHGGRAERRSAARKRSQVAPELH